MTASKNHSIESLRHFVESKQHVALKSACLDVLSMSSDDVPAVVLLALAYVYLGEHDNAETHLISLGDETTHWDDDVLCDLAAVHIARHDIDKAVSILDGVVTRSPNHDLALARLGWCHMANNASALALPLLERSLVLYPNRIAVHLNRLQLLISSDSVVNNKDASSANTAIRNGLDDAYVCLLSQKEVLSETFWGDAQARWQRLQLQWWVTLENYAAAEDWLSHDHGLRESDARLNVNIQYARILLENDQHDMAYSFLQDLLKNHPNTVSILLLLSEISEIQGRVTPAVAFIQQAIVQEPENSVLWSKMSNAHLHHFSEKARYAAEKANELAKAMVAGAEHSAEQVALYRDQAKHALAMVELDSKAFDKAESMFLEILADKPYFLPALAGLGQQRMEQGRIDDAIALFEKVKEIDPIKGISLLINAHRFPEDEDTLNRLEHTAKLPSIEGSMQSSLLFKLATAWEKRKNYSKAFELATLANQSSLRLLNYDPKAHRDRCARIRYVFSSSLYEHRPDCGVASSLPVFVLGMPRSGTTLVEQIISGHSDIFGAGELGIIPSVIQGLNRWERHVGSGRHYPDCIDDLGAIPAKGIADSILEEMQAFAPEAKHIVDKLPHNFENIGLIKFLFPNAKIISVRRDPRDIAVSNYFTDYQAKHGGMGFAYDLTNIGEQLADHNLLMHHWNQVFPGQILEVSYESVVENLEGSARRMLDYIGVEWEPDVLKFNELGRSVKTASVWQVRQPLYKTSKAKWLHYQSQLAPLIKGTNARIISDPVTMLTLPVAGFLDAGVSDFKNGKLYDAEMNFRKMLHHNPNHAACQYMTGLICFHKGKMEEGISLVESALSLLPWKKEWRDNLIKAYEQTGQSDKAEALAKKESGKKIISPLNHVSDDTFPIENDPHDHLDDEDLYPLVGAEQFL